MKKNTFKNYIKRVPMEYQEKNFKSLQKKLSLSKTDDNCKIRFCKNCQDPYQQFLTKNKITKFGCFIVFMLLLGVIAMGSLEYFYKVPTFQRMTSRDQSSSTSQQPEYN